MCIFVGEPSELLTKYEEKVWLKKKWTN
jgi:hypothetical protein